ncbi:hypothetical protein B7760_05793 (plasmid) [Burkholderia glumae]|nr:hypothetical protein B7760_05793 [Burkholderia glumae]
MVQTGHFRAEPFFQQASRSAIAASRSDFTSPVRGSPTLNRRNAIKEREGMVTRKA